MRFESNIEFLTRVMDYSKYGALMQAFVIEAVNRYAEDVIVADMPKDSIISPEAWKGCAKEFLDEFKKHPITVENRKQA